MPGGLRLRPESRDTDCVVLPYMSGHGIEADEQRMADVAVSLAGGDEAQHFDLARR